MLLGECKVKYSVIVLNFHIERTIKANLLKSRDAKLWVYGCEICSYDRQATEENDYFIVFCGLEKSRPFFI